ncbi:MAG: hypothetical protein R2755_26825 [Acidimicrobiales bacterium]
MADAAGALRAVLWSGSDAHTASVAGVQRWLAGTAWCSPPTPQGWS